MILHPANSLLLVIRRQPLLLELPLRRLENPPNQQPHEHHDADDSSNHGVECLVARGTAVGEDVGVSRAVVGDHRVAGEETCGERQVSEILE
jgi:hypothetical protein